MELVRTAVRTKPPRNPGIGCHPVSSDGQASGVISPAQRKELALDGKLCHRPSSGSVSATDQKVGGSNPSERNSTSSQFRTPHLHIWVFAGRGLDVPESDSRVRGRGAPLERSG
jgi:hypothetical protein